MLKNRFTSLRFRSVRSHLYGLFLTTIILLAVLLSVYVLISPPWLAHESIFLFISMYVILATVIALFVGFHSSGHIIDRLSHLSVLITQFANGNYKSRVHFNEKDEITRIGNEMNELGMKMQNQVKSLQRMAEEKAEFSKLAHKSAVIEERQRLARDLHDAVSQQLFALTMMSEAALKQIEQQPELAKEQLTEVVKAAHHSQAEMRALLLHLRPVHLSGDSLAVGIAKLIKELEDRSKIQFVLTIGEDLELSESIEEHVFRIIQEAFSNILRHANATEVKLSIKKHPRELFVHINDNGKGFSVDEKTNTKASFGLKTMQERTEELGGTFSIRSRLEAGTYIDIRIPC